MAVVYGIAGMRDRDGRIAFRPKLPPETGRLRFPLTVRRCLLEVDIRGEGVTYLLKEGGELKIEHYGEELTLKRGEPVTATLGRAG